MKSFRAFYESPLDDALQGKLQKEINKGEGNIHTNKFISIIKKYSKKAYPKLAKNIKSKGMWRIPLLVPVLKDKFSVAEQKALGYKNNHIPTVIKVADGTSNDGYKMNKKEYDIWQDVKRNKEWSKWLCPVFDDTDTSLFKNLTPSDVGYKFIQMAYCKKTNLIDEVHDWFGLNVYLIREFFDDVASQNYEEFDLGKMIKEVQEMNPYFNPNAKQRKNLKSICGLVMNYRIEDLHHNNFGMLGDQIVILDYGDAQWEKDS
jgi:hypothetical protein